MRLAKYLAHAGVASRRKAEEIVAAGRVTVGGKVVRDPARDVDDSSDVRVDRAPVHVGTGRQVVYAVHKPAGVVSTARDPGGRPVVVDLVDSDVRLYPVGRLDADATGLILLTNDGELAHALTHPSFEVPKTYRALVRNPPIKEPALRALREGIELDDGPTAPAKVRKIGPGEIELTIHEGRKRQVKRMCEAVGHRVKSLQRIAFGGLRLGGLAEGAYRRLNETEIQRLRDVAGLLESRR
ncbi:MAG: Ribosomal large subunit pseudouridine synthase B [uncultured Solirubrobacteraceae bacterium]|uniref:Pseudouridine synthase n=1 Tax=uncultured Solirubrobacteraceae bacterium TaxID=1162706 RepID=A0A6J4TYE6_9ACTN|nr:MAG: Ribosomal large subunit pseudouridine synthase B [uncultured Solirubrobacteraceae bacterium]